METCNAPTKAGTPCGLEIHNAVIHAMSHAAAERSPNLPFPLYSESPLTAAEIARAQEIAAEIGLSG